MSKYEFIFSRFGLFSISREKIEFIHQVNLGEASKDILANSLPFGDPPNKSIKFSLVNGTNYLSYSYFNPKKDEGRGLLINLTFKDNLLKHTLSVFNNLEETVLSEQNFQKLLQTDKLSIQGNDINNLNKSLTINHLDGILFALLAHTPLTILGSHEQIINFLKYFITILPNWITDSYTFITQTNSLSENVKIVGMNPKKSILQNIEIEEKFGRTIIYLDKSRVFAPLTSQLCRKLAMLLKENNNKEFMKILNDFHRLILQNISLKNVEEIIKKINLDFDDAQFFIALKGVIEGKPINPLKFDQKGVL